MAAVNPWMVAAGLLLLGLVPCGVVMIKGELADGLAALQVAGTLTTMALLAMAAGYGRPSIADIPTALAILSFPSALLFAHFLERWL